MNDVLNHARDMGVTVIHAPSDCMPQYTDHPARERAKTIGRANNSPHDVAAWCSLVPSEELGVWPIDQTDGGEDDDPKEHAAWVEELKSQGRNPGTPWLKQTDMIDIDESKDYVSDRGDEIWNILESRSIQNVVLTGVHTNMCVIGRPFGLRQMARNGKNVVLMRDMTDTMYNPKRWPYVSHFTGTRLIVSHIERYICPTISSDQLIGGTPFQFTKDDGANATHPKPTGSDFADRYLAGETGEREASVGRDKDWRLVKVPSAWETLPGMSHYDGIGWYRCTVKVPGEWLQDDTLRIELDTRDDRVAGWLNGQPMWQRGAEPGGSVRTLSIERDHVHVDDVNLLVLRVDDKGGAGGLQSAPKILSSPVGSESGAGSGSGSETLPDSFSLAGRWQFRAGDDSGFSDIPLPAKFGTSADMVFVPPEPLWQPRAFTLPHAFTPGIEGPACDREGNVYAVNLERQGSIGLVRQNGEATVFVDLPSDSIGNGVRFAVDGQSFFVADYTGHNVLRVDLASRKVTTVAHNPAMNQPNDLAIAPSGTLYASDPDWSNDTGQIWRISMDGTTKLVAPDMGTTNGIDVSPDGKRLYVNESVQRNIWEFDIAEDESLTNKRLFRKFDDHGFDGMRFDVDGNLYVTRYGKGTVVKLSPDGEVLQEIPVLGSRPSNLCFGGPGRLHGVRYGSRFRASGQLSRRSPGAGMAPSQGLSAVHHDVHCGASESPPMNQARIQELLATYRDGLLNDCLPFWIRHSVDREFGGFLTALDREGRVVDSDKGVWQQGRFTWLLGELYNNVEPRAEWLQLAMHGARFLEDHCFDPADGRMWFHVTREGAPLRKRRYAFSESFAAIAFGELAQATGDESFAVKARNAFGRFLDHNLNPDQPGPKFTDVRPTIGLGFPMITIATAQELRDSIDLSNADVIIDQSIETIRKYHVKDSLRCVMETVGTNGEVLDHFDGRTLNPGHAIEGAWFIIREGRHRADSKLIKLGCRMLDYMWERGWDTEHGGMLYFVDLDGHPVQEYWHDMKFWWPQNETIIATLLAWLVSGDDKYAMWHARIHDWAYRHFPDPEHGEWFGYMHRDGRLSSALKGGLWKGPFHLPRMQLVCWHLLEEKLAG